MIVTMDEPKNRAKRGRGRPPKNPTTPIGERSNIGFSARISPQVAARFVEFHARFDSKNQLKTDKSAHIEKAIVQYLDREEPRLDQK